jgi:drug/metabolite transporter (DMT)-like permease
MLSNSLLAQVLLRDKQTAGILAALGSAFFLGVSPVLGKMAITLGLSPLAVVALRTGFAALLLLLLISIFFRPYLYIFPAGLAGCMLAGAINGLGSLFYYMALYRLPASLGQLLYSLYPFFVAIWLVFDKQPISKLTMVRVGIAMIAVVLLTNVPGAQADMLGVLMMLIAAILYAMHLPINQRVLYEVPAPTVTLYTLLSMSAVVVPAYFIFDRTWPAAVVPWGPVLGLTFATLFSRLSLFLGVKGIGGMQTALLGLAELLVTLLLSHFWLRENLTTLQWIGVLALAASLVMVRFDRTKSTRHGPGGWLSWIRAPQLPKDLWPPYE